jgi:long-chain fatty acid transport protein
MRRNAVLSVMLALVGLTFAARGAQAQGFGVYEHDACMMGRAGTGVAAPCSNAAAIFANPAGIVNGQQTGRRWELSLGVTAIAPTFAFRDSITGVTTDAVKNTIPVPNIYATRQMGRLAGRYPWAVGLGVYAPYGLISEWPETFAGRFLAYYSDLKSIYIQPTMAVQFRPWLSVGAGFDYIYSKVDLKQRADLAANPVPSTSVPAGTTFGQLGIPQGTDFADAELTGSSHSAGAHIGMMITTDRVNIGVRYLVHSIADIQGDASFAQLATGITLPPGSPLNPTAAAVPLDSVLASTFSTTLADQHASVRIPLPDQLVIGTSIQATDAFRLLFDFQYTYWSRFKELRLVFQNLGTRPQWEDYNNTVGLRLGGEYRVSPSLMLRAGGLVHEAAAPSQTVTPLLPEAERSEGTIGASLRIGRSMMLDVAYQKIWQADRRGRIQEPPVRGPAGAAANTGLYTGGANLFGANLVWRF